MTRLCGIRDPRLDHLDAFPKRKHETRPLSSFWGMERSRWILSMKQTSRLRLLAVIENVAQILDCVTESAKAAGVSDQSLYQIQLAVDEACANVVHHAYEGMAPGDMEVACQFDDQVLTVRVRDWGPGFAPGDVPAPDVAAPLEDRSLGGLGLFLIRQMMDEVHYTCDPEKGNVLTMSKRFQGGG